MMRLCVGRDGMDRRVRFWNEAFGVGIWGAYLTGQVSFILGSYALIDPIYP